MANDYEEIIIPTDRKMTQEEIIEAFKKITRNLIKIGEESDQRVRQYKEKHD
jgi:hypothetical protein